MKISNWKMNYMEYKALDCTAPCSMYSVLLDKGLIEDPFYGMNENKVMPLSNSGCEFYSEFELTEEVLQRKYVELIFLGLDTICDVYFNDIFLAHNRNMHRRYVYDIRSIARVGRNTVKVVFYSPTEYFARMNQKHFLYTNKDTIPGAAHLRKALYMSGWDWGPSLPDMGLFREVEIDAYDIDKIENTIIRQRHRENAVDLTFDVSTVKQAGCDVYVEIDGQRVLIPDNRTKVTVEAPKLWWVRGLGEQPLYDVTFTLEKDGQLVDRVTKRIGLRTLTVSTAKVKDGNEFCFIINGVKFFAMGANYIPQDNIISRITPEITRKRIDDFCFANYNCIRVWGGGYYPEDYFFDMCDEAGLVVWEDFMLACMDVWLGEEMEKELIAEATYNLNRISHHASLGILCGNNEMEKFSLKKNSLVKMDYLRLYERIFPDLCDKYAPDTFYWPSSPSSGGGWDDPDDSSRGDVHYWKVWSGGLPYEEYRNHKFRFCSEYGFESFPNIKTVRSYSEPKDENVYSRVMEHHQKCPNRNPVMMRYMADYYLYPYSFDKIVYASQLMQAEAIQYAVTHFRRTRGYCMGSLYWQANDCWPVASWSSIDYYGRYKALHYAARKFYAPIATGLFCEDDKITVNVQNETLFDQNITVRWAVCKNDNTVIYSGEIKERAEKLSSFDLPAIKVPNMDVYSTYFYADLYDEAGSFIMRQTQLFTKPKHFDWIKPEIRLEAKDVEGGVEFCLSANVFAKAVELDFANRDVILSDNYMDLVDGNAYVITAKTEYSAEELLADARIQSVYDIR